MLRPGAMVRARPSSLLSLLTGRNAAAAAALVAVACNSTTSVTDGTLIATSVQVQPADFLGKQVCLDAEGAVRLYQATLIDVTSDLDEPFALASSEVLSCKSAAYFGFVTPGRRYTAFVEAFDASGLRTQSPGVRVVVDADGAPVFPRWTTTCRGEDDVRYGGAGGQGGEGGQSALGVEAQLNSRVYVQGCAPLLDSGQIGPTGISVSLSGSLLELRCGTGPGQIERFVVQTGQDVPQPGGAGGQGGEGGSGGGGSSAPSGGTLCGQTARIVNLVPGVTVKYRVEAFEAGKTEATYFTTCRAFTARGVVVPAHCEPLQPIAL